jgi:hypothetical protein
VEDFYPPEPDIMCQRVAALVELAHAADGVKNRQVRTCLLKAMNAVVHSIDLPRGQLIEVPKTADQPAQFRRAD